MRRYFRVLTFVIIAVASVVSGRNTAGQDSSPSVKLKIQRGDLKAGGFATIAAEVVVAPDAAGVAPKVTIDPIEVDVDKFVRFMTGDGRWIGCATETFCYGDIVRISIHTPPGIHRVVATAVDSRGRTGTGSIDLEIAPPTDGDADGLPDDWELHYTLSRTDAGGQHGPDGDPDGDGIVNLEEFRRGTNPIARYQRVFTEGSYGERQVLTTCFTISRVTDEATAPGPGPVRVLVTGDDGRSKESFFSGFGSPTECPLGGPPFVGDRIVKVAIESIGRLAVERTSLLGTNATLANASLGVGEPSRTWHFARGGAHGDLDLFFLTFNPHPFPVDATFEFLGDEGQPPIIATRTLEPNVRTTIWVNREIPEATASDMAATVSSAQPIFIERAWRYRTPGKTAPHDSVSPGGPAPSPSWYFAVGDLSAPFDTTFALFNASGEDTVVDAQFLFTDGESSTRRLRVPAQSRVLIAPRQLGISAEAAALALRARNGIGIVAERTVDSVTQSGAWRQSAMGATAAGARWVFADVRNGPDTDIVIANPSDVSGRARLHFYAKYSYAIDVVRFVDVPARRVVRVPSVPGPFLGGSWLIVTSEPTSESAAPPSIVVERVTYVDVDNVRRARQATIIGNLQ